MQPARVVFCRSNPVAPDPRVEKEAAALVKSGYVVQIIAWDRSGMLAPAEQVHGASLQRLPIRAEYASGVHNLPALIRWQWALLRWLVHWRGAYDLIHACDFDTILPALLCQKLFGKTVVYDIFDFYADHLRATPTWLKGVVRAIDLRAINQADAVILADDSRREQISGATPQRSVVIYNSPEERGTMEAVASRPESSQLHLVYVGLLQVERGLFEMLEVLRQHPEWSLSLAGFGGDEDQLVAQAAKLPNVFWRGRVDYATALQLSAEADVLFATYDPAIPNHRFSSPNKIFEAMMLGKPIIVAQGTNMDKLITAANCGLVVPYGDIAALKAALQKLVDDPGLRNQLATNARQAYQDRYSWTIMRQRLLDLYAGLSRHTHPVDRA